MTTLTEKSDGFFVKALNVCGKLLYQIFPIKREEMLKVFTLTILFNMMILQYSMMRAMKDSFVLTYIKGVNVILYLKMIFVLLGSLGFSWLYSSLTKKYAMKKVFYIIMTGFIVILGLYCFVFFPYYEKLLLPVPAIILNHTPKLFHAILGCYSQWMHTMFYVAAEIFGGFGIGLLFWDFVNKNLNKSQVKRLYPCLLIFAQAGVYLSSVFLIYFASLTVSPAKKMQIAGGILLTICLCTMASYFVLNEYLLIAPKKLDEEMPVAKKKVSMIEAIITFISSKNVILIASLTILYGMIINLLEVSWKNDVKTMIELLPISGLAGGREWQSMLYFANWQKKQAKLTALIGIVGQFFFPRMGWFGLAIATPIIMTLGGILSFSVKQIGEKLLSPLDLISSKYYGITNRIFSLPILNFFQSTHNNVGYTNLSTSAKMISWVCDIRAFMVIFSRGTKYILHDYTKESAVRNLDKDEQTKTKIAEGFASRSGKMSGSMIQIVTSIFTTYFMKGFNKSFIMELVSLTVIVILSILWIICNIAINQYIIQPTKLVVIEPQKIEVVVIETTTQVSDIDESGNTPKN